MDNIPDGRHLAKVIDYGLGKTATGKDQAWAKFKLDGDGAEIYWYGTLSEGRGREITIDALLTMGFAGNDLTALEDGSGTNALDEKKSVIIVVEQDTYNGKTKPKVKWINSVDAPKTAKKPLDASDRARLKSLGSDIAARRKEMNIPVPEEDLPF